MKIQVIKAANLPPKYPVWWTAWAWLLLFKMYSAPGWLVGIVGTLLGIAWIGVAVLRFNVEPTDIFAKKDAMGGK